MILIPELLLIPPETISVVQELEMFQRVWPRPSVGTQLHATPALVVHTVIQVLTMADNYLEKESHMNNWRATCRITYKIRPLT